MGKNNFELIGIDEVKDTAERIVLLTELDPKTKQQEILYVSEPIKGGGEASLKDAMAETFSFYYNEGNDIEFQTKVCEVLDKNKKNLAEENKKDDRLHKARLEASRKRQEKAEQRKKPNTRK